ncbi:MAG: hypothetical protein ACK5MD_02110 [Flavobacteriales bacterium]
MDITNFTREELAQYILHTAKDSVIAKFKAILEKENKEDIVAYTVQGKYFQRGVGYGKRANVPLP